MHRFKYSTFESLHGESDAVSKAKKHAACCLKPSNKVRTIRAVRVGGGGWGELTAQVHLLVRFSPGKVAFFV